MKYFIVADIHGFYSEFIAAVTQSGFNPSNPNHKLIICGDLMDRGSEAKQLEAYIYDLLRKHKVIFVRGNHEDLMLKLIDELPTLYGYICSSHPHVTNGTVSTLCQLTGMTAKEVMFNPYLAIETMHKTPFVNEIIPKSVDYFETPHYVFVHGWIPLDVDNWRNASKKEWEQARWYNGMNAAHCGVTLPDKTIVCGHWHTSYGHSYYEHNGSEFGDDADFSPYKAKGIIALDACTAYSHKVNCLVVED